MINNISSHPVLINSSILGNVNRGYDDGSTLDPFLLKLYESSLIGNVESSTCRLINTTVANNTSLTSTATSNPLVFNMVESFTDIVNSIIWGNTTKSILDSATAEPSKVVYSLMEGLAADAANHVLDGTLNTPIFADSATGNYQLVATSAAINAGSNDALLQTLAAYIPAITGGGLDLADSIRILDGMVDLGAYEFVATASLPVTLKYFSGKLQNSVARFNWASGLEAQFKEYVIEKSEDGTNFLPLATVTPKGSNSTYAYTTVQTKPTVYYRLKMVDMSGKLGYSAVVRLSQNTGSQRMQLYPNPAASYIHIRVEDLKAVSGLMRIYNAAGSLVKSVTLKAGVNTIDISGLAAGIYYALPGKGNQRLPFVVK